MAFERILELSQEELDQLLESYRDWEERRQKEAREQMEKVLKMEGIDRLLPLPQPKDPDSSSEDSPYFKT